jgi:hypothetical protein
VRARRQQKRNSCRSACSLRALLAGLPGRSHARLSLSPLIPSIPAEEGNSGVIAGGVIMVGVIIAALASQNGGQGGAKADHAHDHSSSEAAAPPATKEDA